jgi:hypothetical protein
MEQMIFFEDIWTQMPWFYVKSLEFGIYLFFIPEITVIFKCESGVGMFWTGSAIKDL